MHGMDLKTRRARRSAGKEHLAAAGAVGHAHDGRAAVQYLLRGGGRRLPGEKARLFVADLYYVGEGHGGHHLGAGRLRGSPEREPEVGVVAYDTAGLPGGTRR